MIRNIAARFVRSGFNPTALFLLLICLLVGKGIRAAESAALAAALSSIKVEDLKRHVQVLADDTFEGREAGSRGGRAAGIYLGCEYQRHHLAGGATNGYYQPFGASYSNILGRLEGADPALRHEVVIISAHYDHVGYGNSSNSYGPTGYIHNGADDNASGVSGLLEAIEAFTRLPQPPRRTILFALWDGEEKGLLGSKHWLGNPTVPLANVVCLINMDMIGRLRGDKLEVYGTRTAPGLRQLVALQNRDTDLLLNFSWEMTENSDHYPFYERGIPILMLHTGLHGDYHRPSDDVERLELAGMERATRLLFQTAHALANQDARPRFRAACRMESAPSGGQFEQSLPPLPSRLGVRFDPGATAGGGIRLTGVDANSPAERAGLQPGDRIMEFAGVAVTDAATFRRLVWSAVNPVPVVVLRSGRPEPLRLALQLDGQPVRFGLSWRIDDAEPGAVILTRVVPGTAAAEAGLRVGDRIYEVNGEGFVGQDEFRRLLGEAAERVALLYERGGRIRTASLETLVATATVDVDQPRSGTSSSSAPGVPYP
jgi:hypothetical protein